MSEKKPELYNTLTKLDEAGFEKMLQEFHSDLGANRDIPIARADFFPIRQPTSTSTHSASAVTELSKKVLNESWAYCIGNKDINQLKKVIHETGLDINNLGNNLGLLVINYAISFYKFDKTNPRFSMEKELSFLQDILACGVDINKSDVMGMTPKNLARTTNLTEVVELLEQYAIKKTTKTASSCRPSTGFFKDSKTLLQQKLKETSPPAKTPDIPTPQSTSGLSS